MDLNIYYGWHIIITPEEIRGKTKSDIRKEIFFTFNQGEWTTESNHRTLIFNDNYYSPIEFYFKEQTTENEKKKGVLSYSLVFDCPFFDSWKQRRNHIELSIKAKQKINWKNQVSYSINGEWVAHPKWRFKKKKQD